MAKRSNPESVKVDLPPRNAGKRYFNFSREDKVGFTILAALILLVVLIRSKFYEIPFERDEGAYSYYGKLLLEGKVPYKDFYEQKFPGIFYFFAMMVGIFGDTVKGMHFGFMLLNILTFILLFLACRRLFSPIAGAITAATYAIVSLTPGLSGFTVQAEHGVAFFISLGLFFYSFTVQNPDWKYFFLMGLAMGGAFMTKTSGVFLVLWGGIMVVIDSIFNGKKFAFKTLLIRALIYSGGVLLVISFFFVLIAIKGSFSEMIYWAIEVPKQYVNKIPWEDGKKYFSYMLESITRDYKFFWIHALFGLLILFLKNIGWRLKIMALLLIFFSGMTIVPGFYFYGHYWIQLLPGLSVLAGITFFAVNDLLRNRLNIKSPRLPYVYVSVFILFTLAHLNKLKSYYFHPNYERILRSVYGNNPFPEAMGIAEYINAHSKPEDGIVVMGSEPEIYFYTRKHCPSRHAYFAALVEGKPESAKWQREFVQDVEKAAPKFFVFFNHQISLFVQPNSDQYIFEWYNKYVTANYNLIGVVDMIDGYSSNYVWQEALNTYKLQSQSVVYIYERKA
jgi:hypothetical protein